MCWDVEAGLHNASVVNHLSFTRRSEFESHNVELLWTEIVIHKFICGVCYRPPSYSSSQFDEFFIRCKTV